MVVHVCERAQKSGAAGVHVATDDKRIFDVVKAHGHRAILTRADHPSGTDRLAEAARKLKLKDNEVVVNVQGDEPLISPKLIAQVARILASRKKASVSTACHAIHDQSALGNPNVVKVVMDAEGYALYFSRSRIPYPREEGAPCYRHAGIYGYRVGFLKKYSRLKPAPLEKAEALEQLRVLWHGFRIAVTVSETEIPPGVDTPQDLEAVRRILA
jgi:3-deoxy-manno-octulosonate cytidylyltransferase (CMP-KDO synthetase)